MGKNERGLENRSGYTPKKRVVEPYDLLYEGIDLKEEIGSKGIRLIIPRIFLHGRQSTEEYSNKKRKQVEVALNKAGINYLLENPVIVCALPLNKHLLLTIIDGHHRTRYSGLYGIHNIPCLVSDLPTIVDVINRHKSLAERVPVEGFGERLRREAAAAISSFSRVLSDERLPKLVPLPDIEALKVKYKTF